MLEKILARPLARLLMGAVIGAASMVLYVKLAGLVGIQCRTCRNLPWSSTVAAFFAGVFFMVVGGDLGPPRRDWE